jgi:anti-sigma regulatory factor (Ser/Thr protein kinase)
MNCGHPDPILICDGGAMPFPPGAGGIPVGLPLGPDRPFEKEDQTIVEASPGMQILIYTDGLTEALHCETGEECERDNLEKLFADVVCNSQTTNSPQALFKSLVDTGYSLGHDDCTAIAVRMVNEGNILMQGDIPVEVNAVSECTEQMEKLLLNQVEEDLAARVRLVAIEHAMNVVEHSGLGPEEVIWYQLSLDETGCRLVFKDRGREWDFNRTAAKESLVDDYAEGGRGIYITNAAASHVERYRRDAYNTVNYLFKRQDDE